MSESPEFQSLKSITFAVLDPNSGLPALTGFFFTADGYGMTAWHGGPFVEGERITLGFQGRSHPATIHRASRADDVAVLHAPGVELKNWIPLSTRFERGWNVLVAGYQFAGQFEESPQPFPQRIDNDAPFEEIRFKDGRRMKCLILWPTMDGKKVLPGSSGGPVLHGDTSSNVLVGMIVGVGDNEQTEGEVRKDQTKTFIVREPRPKCAFAVPFDGLFTDWPAFRLLISAKLPTMAEAEERIRQMNRPPPPVVREPLDAEPLLLPVPPPRFEMAAGCVTNEEFKRFTEQENNYWQPSGRCRTENRVDALYLDHWNGADWEQIREQPVVNVSVFAAIAYLEWLSRIRSRKFRLPLLQELESAASCGRGTGAWKEQDRDNGCINCGGHAGRISKVSEGRSNPWGFFHLLGNVYQLCSVRPTANSEARAYGGSFRSPFDKLQNPITVGQNECHPEIGFRYVAEYVQS